MITAKIVYLHKDDLLLVGSDSVECRRSQNSFSVRVFFLVRKRGKNEEVRRICLLAVVNL